MSDTLLNLIPCRLINQPLGMMGWRADTPITNVFFLERVSSWHALLAQLPGQKYALYFEDSIEFAAALWGAWHAGKTIWLAADTLTSTTTALKLHVDGFLGDFPADCSPVQYVDDATAGKIIEYKPLDDQFIGLVVHTSGTTGTAQAIPKKMSQLATEVATLEKLFGEKMGNAEIISTVTHQHIYGLLFKVLWPLTVGRPIHAQALFFPEELAKVISTRTCVLISSPAHLKRLPAHLNWSGKCQAVFSSGGVLPYSVAHSASTLLGQRPIEIFGSSETGGIAWRQRSADTDQAWSPMPDVSWRMSNMEHLIEVRSPHLLTNEWFQLSDQIEAQSDGRFILKGRSDRIVKIEEKRISLDFLEQCLNASSLIVEAKLIVFNEERRQHLGAVVVLSESGRDLLQKNGKVAVNRQLRNILVNAVEAIAIPRRWRYVDQLPVNKQGKTTQMMLRELFSPHKSAAPNVKLLNRDKHGAEFELSWPPNFIYFEGHFPQAPVLPGVVQLDWAIETGRDFFNLPTQVGAIHALKFQHVILPNTPVNLKLTFDSQKACLSFSYFSSTKQHASGRILFTDAA